MLEHISNLISKFSEKQAEKEFRRWQKMYSEKDGKKILNQEENFTAIFQKSLDLKKVEDVSDLFMLFKDYYDGNYNHVPLLTISSIGGYFLYLSRPTVLTPVAPNFYFGYFKDRSLFQICLEYVKEDLEKYREWNINNRQNILL
jgi:uncharacterized membrane protein YkvA (DUF1232 family)